MNTNKYHYSSWTAVSGEGWVMMGGDNDPFSAWQGSPPHCESPSTAFPSSASLCVRFCPPHLLWSLVVCVWLPGFCTLIHLLLIVLTWLSLVCSQIKIEPPPPPRRREGLPECRKVFMSADNPREYKAGVSRAREHSLSCGPEQSLTGPQNKTKTGF